MTHGHGSTATRRRRRGIDLVLTGTGEVLVTVGLVIALFLVWQLWWTGIAAAGKADAVTATFSSTQVDSPRVEGTRHYDDPPAFTAVGYGQTIGMLVVPRWDGVTDNNMPVIEGTGSDVLDQAAAGHYTTTQQVGEVGNFAIAGHRRTYGNSFRRIDLLQPGDEIMISTADTWYVYTVTGHEIVTPDAADVLDPIPHQPGATPTQRILTMTTCHSTSLGEWGNDHRWVTYATFSYWMPRSEGRPASVLDDQGVS